MRPDRTIANTGWSVTPLSTPAWDAVNDYEFQPSFVDGADYIDSGGVAERSIELGLSGLNMSNSDIFSSGKIWFYANTGPTSQLLVSVKVAGTVVNNVIIGPNQPFYWRSLDIPAGTIDGLSKVNTLSIRFWSLQGGQSAVRAAYAEVQPGVYKFQNANYPNRHMEVRGGSTTNGALVGLAATSTGLHQRFYVYETRTGLALRPQHSNMCLTPNGRSISSGSLIVQYGCSYDNPQVYSIAPIGNNKHLIRNVGSNLCLTPRFFDLYIHQVACNGAAVTQQWYVERHPL